MRTLRAWMVRAAGLVGRTRRERELADEIESHLQLHVDDSIRAGLSPAEARRAAVLKLGGVEPTKEAWRDRRSLPVLEPLARDLRFGARLLVRQKAFSAIAIVLLAVGIGANVAAFTIVDALLLRPAVGRPAGQVVGLYSRDRTRPDTYRAFSYPEYEDVRAHTDVFASVAAHNLAFVGLADPGGATRRVFADIVTANYFQTYGVSLGLGRTFRPEEERPGADIAVAILGESAAARLGGGAGVLGGTVTVNGRAFTVVGVAPRGFGGNTTVIAPSLFLPLGVYDTVMNDFARADQPGGLADRRHRNLIVVAQLPPGATIASTHAAVDGIGGQMAHAYPADSKDQELLLAPLSRTSISTEPETDAGPATVAVALLSMAALVLIIASFNVANMLLARSGARSKEMAVRLAIGGSRGRLVRQLLAEGFVLAAAGGLAGLALAAASTRAIFAAIAAAAPLDIAIDAAPDWRIVAALAAYAVVSTLAFALVPAWKLTRPDAAPALKDQAGELLSGRRSRWSTPNLLVMAQLACSLVMVTVGAVFLRGARAAAAADPGFTLDRGVLVELDPSLAGAADTRARETFASVLDRVRARPDVVAASIASTVPFGDISIGESVQKAGAPIRRGDANDAGLVEAQFTSIGRDYFKALGLAILRGRDFTADEARSADGPRVAIVDEPLARRLFADGAALGRDVQYTPEAAGAAPIVLRVVGVSPGVKQSLFDLTPVPHLYVPYGRQFQADMWLHVRTSAPDARADAALLPGLRRMIRDVDPSVPILTLETRAAFRDSNPLLALVRIGAAVFSVFGLVALIVAALGVYGLKAYLVERRRREIGIRLALGAAPSAVVRMVIGDGLAPTLVGLVAGFGLAVLAGLAMRGLSFQERRADPLLVLGALLVLVGAGLLASWLPARRAARIDPSRVLRQA